MMLCRVLESMDVEGVLQPDMLEQLLKFVPSSEEVLMLEEHSEDLATFARADAFMLRVAR